jgi:metal-dependent amidase/aminoacylase/carboxypeptidase family protein
MENTIATEVSLKTRADYQAVIEQCLAEMQRLHEQIAAPTKFEAECATSETHILVVLDVP